MGQPPKRPDHDSTIASRPRAGTILGDRGDIRTPRTPPRNVGLTEPPAHPRHPTPVAGTTAIVPRHEFDFEQRTPPAMDTDTYHALQTIQSQALASAKAILDMVKKQDDDREARELVKRQETEKQNAARSERRAKYIVPVITAVFIGIIGVIGALMHGCS